MGAMNPIVAQVIQWSNRQDDLIASLLGITRGEFLASFPSTYAGRIAEALAAKQAEVDALARPRSDELAAVDCPTWKAVAEHPLMMKVSARGRPIPNGVLSVDAYQGKHSRNHSAEIHFPLGRGERPRYFVAAGWTPEDEGRYAAAVGELNLIKNALDEVRGHGRKRLSIEALRKGGNARRAALADKKFAARGGLAG